MRTTIDRSLLAAVLLLPVACGGSQPESQTETTTPMTTSSASTTTTIQPQEVDPWLAMDEHGLPLYVQNRARERIAEVQPGFDLAQLEAYIADHDSAPEISGRTVERLFDLATVALAAGNLDRAAGIVRLVRARAKNRNSAYAGVTMLSEIARRRAAGAAASEDGEEPAATEGDGEEEAGGGDGEAESEEEEAAAGEADTTEAQKEAIAAVLRELPKNRFGSATVIFQLFQTQEQLAARVELAKQQMVSLETASSVLFFRDVLPEIVQNRATFLAAIEAVQAEHERSRGPREYRFPTVDLTRDRNAEDVIVGVWDVGTNPALFEEQLFVNDDEEANGEDDDENGLVDDISGVVADGDAPNTALLFEPSAQTLEEYTPFLKGIMDLRAGLASTEAAGRVLELMRSADSVEALESLEQNLDQVGEWAHGTHVAGIMLAGNPHAQLAIFRSAWAGEARVYYHRGPTDEELALERQNAENVATFINDHGVKVVNASLGFSRDYVEDQLRYENDRYQTAEQVRARADEIMEHRAGTWRTVFEACPDTLFVIAAGNSNRDVVEYGDVPSSLELPNVLAVGAVDKYGMWATFTNSNPERVRVFDHGVAVDSLIPNGETLPLSGTSMASPNVANLAGKMYAVHPGLNPAQAISIIVETGDEIDAPFDGVIANERRAITRARLAARRAR